MERHFFEQRLAACESLGAQRATGQFWESSFEPSQTNDGEDH
jgi:hypothetical protein